MTCGLCGRPPFCFRFARETGSTGLTSQLLSAVHFNTCRGIGPISSSIEIELADGDEHVVLEFSALRGEIRPIAS